MKKQWLFALITFGIIALLGILLPYSFDTGDTSGIDIDISRCSAVRIIRTRLKTIIYTDGFLVIRCTQFKTQFFLQICKWLHINFAGYRRKTADGENSLVQSDSACI